MSGTETAANQDFHVIPCALVFIDVQSCEKSYFCFFLFPNAIRMELRMGAADAILITTCDGNASGA